MEINYREQVITVDQTGLFEINWEESIIDEVKQSLDIVDTLQEAKDLIDTRLKTLAKKEPLNLAALSRSGVPITLTGIHLGTHNILSQPPLTRGLDGRVYLDHPHIRSQLARLRAIQEEAKAIDQDISVYTIKTSYGSGRMEVEEYEGYIAELKESYAAAQTKMEESASEERTA